MGIFNFKKELSTKIKIIEKDFKNIVKKEIEDKEHVSILRYGAYDIDPKYLVIWIITQSDKMRDHLKNNERVKKILREKLDHINYPKSAINNVNIEFESEETIKRESNGDLYVHFK